MWSSSASRNGVRMSFSPRPCSGDLEGLVSGNGG